MSETLRVKRACPICGATQGERLHTQRFVVPSHFVLPAHYDLVACPGCGFVYADTPAPQAAYDAYYRDFSIYEDRRIASGTGTAPWERERFDGLAEILAAHVPPDASILDIGAANGGLLLALRRHGFEHLSALEPASGCVQHLRAQGFTAHQGTLLAPPAMPASQVVVLSHVLEHVRDLAAASGALEHLVPPGGWLYVEVPDAARYPQFYQVPYYYFDIEHINHFDGPLLDNLFGPRGFEPVSAGARDLPTSGGGLYPATYKLYRRGRTARGPRYVGGVRASVLAYLALSQERSRHAELEALAEAQTPIVVWGAGMFARRLLADTALGRCRIVAFVDNDPNKHGLSLAGARIEPPDYLRGTGFAGPVVVCSALHADDVVAELREMAVNGPTLVVR